METVSIISGATVLIGCGEAGRAAVGSDDMARGGASVSPRPQPMHRHIIKTSGTIINFFILYHQLTRGHKVLRGIQHAIAASNSFEISPVFLRSFLQYSMDSSLFFGCLFVHYEYRQGRYACYYCRREEYRIWRHKVIAVKAHGVKPYH